MEDRLKQLRKKAELLLNENENLSSDIPRGDFNRIIQELKVYQIELEIQNEELREAQRSLEESRNGYAFLYNHAPAGYVTLSHNSMILQANQTFFNMLNEDMHEVLNSSFAEYIAPDDQKAFLSRYNAFFKKPDQKKMELRMMRQKGRPFYVRITGRSITDNLKSEKSEIDDRKLFIIISDITQEKQYEASLIESENNYRTLANAGQALIWSSDTDKLCNYFNDVWLNFTGRSLEMEMGNGWAEGVHPDDLERCINIYTSAFDKREKFSMEYRLRRFDGEYRWILDDGAPRYNSDGVFIGYIGFCLDIDESKKNKIQLAESEENYRKISYELEAILDHIPGLIFYKDWENNFIRVNKYVADLHHKNKSELENVNISEVYPAELAQKYFEDDLQVLNSGVPKLNYEEPWETPEGTKWLNTSKIPFVDGNGQVLGIIGISMDITKRKKNEEELAIKNKELSKLNAEKDKFFSVIAHDLKSPFNSIVGFSELLVERAGEGDCQGIAKFADIIQQSSERAMDLLMNLMVWSQSQTGRMEFNPEYFELVNVINDHMLFFRDIAGQKSITISSKLPPNTPVFADKAMINTVLRNLISNAIKFTHPGGNIDISIEEKTDEIMVLVADNGVGISGDSIEKLFRIDENFTTKGTQNEKGTGLGLILCKEFIEKHGGRICAESKVNKGSRFYFSLPLKR